MKKLMSLVLALALSLTTFAMTASAKHSPETVLKSIKSLAEEGGILNCDLTVKDTTVDDFIDEFGQPDRDNYVKSAKGSYATYSHENFVVGYNNGEQVFELRSYSKRLKDITEHALVEAWGTPDHIAKLDGQRMVSYILSEEFNVKFVFDQNGEKLNHYNVIWLDGTKDNMAGDHGRNW